MSTSTPPPVGMDSFFTRESANQGIKLPLYTPDGTKTDHWVRILGIDSDVYRSVEHEERRKALTLRGKPSEEITQAMNESSDRILSSLVVEWSFDEPCTEENKLRFLREAPQIAEQINKFSGDRRLFFVNASSSLPTSPKPTSD